MLNRCKRVQKFSLEFIKGIKNLLFTPACLLCQEPLIKTDFKTFCEECQNHFEWIDYQNKLETCAGISVCPYIRKLLTTFSYQGSAEALLTAFKVNKRSDLSQVMGALMVLQWLKAGLPLPDFLVPAPSSPLANYKRGFSPSLLLAESIGKLLNRPVWSGLKAEVSFIKQSQKTKQERLKLSEDHFYLSKSYQILKDKHIVLVDDIITTGHTLHLASSVLLEVLPKQIDALSFARAD